MFTVIAGIDTDQARAVAQARAIASMPCADSDVRAILLHAFGENPEGGTVEQVKAAREARAVLEEAGVEAELQGYGGDAAKAILQVADDEDADRIVLAGRKRTPAGKVLFGSVTQSVILSTDRPVLVCSAEGEAEGQ